VQQTEGWLPYDLRVDLVPTSERPVRGQEQKWFLLRFHGRRRVNLETEHPNFSDWRWAGGARSESTTSYPFKRRSYTAVVNAFADPFRETPDNTARERSTFARLRSGYGPMVHDRNDWALMAGTLSVVPFLRIAT